MNRRWAREGAGVALAAVAAFAAAAVVTWPVVLHLDEVVLGGGELGGWLWRYDWHFRSLDAIWADEDLGLFAAWREFVGLGRYPETGNILDVLAFSYPLERAVGFPASYNLKILLILVLNGVCGYGLARYFSGSIAAAFAASLVAVVNPLTLLEVQACGLRQAILWWVLLYPALLDRALRRRTVRTGLLAGACWGAAGAFYWFYGLFTLIFTGVWLIKHVVVERPKLLSIGFFRSMFGLGAGTLAVAVPFLLPYLPGSGSDQPQGGGGGGGGLQEQLPEMTFFLPFPAYDTISHAPMRPDSYAENVHASLHRTIGSSWSATYPFDPQLNEALPLAVAAFGLLPALLRRRSWGWLAVWTVFYLGTLGPYLRIGKGDNQNVLRVFDDYVIRMPYTLMFQFIPGMARMFAPYRLGAFVVVASVVLLAMGLARLPWRSMLAPLVAVSIVAQPLYRWGKGAVNEGDADSREWRSPIKINRIRVPDYYRELDADELGGIVELPLEQQQDLTCFYQILHRQKVYRSWASPGSIPPALRKKGKGGEAGERLRFQARPDVTTGPVPEAWMEASRNPDVADLSVLAGAELGAWAEKGSYRRVIVHERGYYLVDPKRGSVLYEAARDQLRRHLAQNGEEYTELEKGDPSNPVLGVPIIGDLVPWTSQPAELPPEIAPHRFRMAVFELPAAPEEGT